MAGPKPRPMRYRKTEDITAFEMTQASGKELAVWCGGKYVENPKKVILPIFHDDNSVTTVDVEIGEWVIKKEDGSHIVWTSEMFSSSGFEPFHHRSPRGSTAE